MARDYVGEDDIKVEELNLDDLRDTEDESSGRERGPKGPGGLRGGGLGPEGSRYQVPEVERRRTWKPIVIALVLFFGGFYGIVNMGLQATIEHQAEGEVFTLEGEVLDYDEAMENNQEPVAGVNVTIEALDLHTVTDSKGRFTIKDVPGGRFEISFFKRSWDQAVNTGYTSLMFTDYSEGAPANFLVEVTDLAPDRSRPVYDGVHSVRAEPVDWPSNTTVRLRVHATAFDEDLGNYTIEVSLDDVTYIPLGPYSNTVDYSIVEGNSQEELWVKVLDPEGREHASTKVDIQEHPLGPGGWEATAFPGVSLYVRNGTLTNGEPRTVLVTSRGSTEFRHRTDVGEWGGWTALEEGQAEFTWEPPARGDHKVHVMTRNATQVAGSPSNVTITMDDTPPILRPSSTSGPAVTDEATFEPGTDAPFFRYSLPDGNWSAWQRWMEEVLVPVDDTGGEATVDFQAMDGAGNLNVSEATVVVQHQDPFEVDDYERFFTNLRICIPIQAVGVILAFYGGLMAYRRKRPTMVMIGAMGALLAAYGLIGAIIAAIALGLVMFSREEFEVPGPPPPREER